MATKTGLQKMTSGEAFSQGMKVGMKSRCRPTGSYVRINGESRPYYGALAPPGVCKTCDRFREEGLNSFLRTTPRPACESGKHNHCTCDTCFVGE